MEDYNLISFTNKLKEWFADSPLFPYYEIGNADNIGLSDYSTYQATKQSAKSKHPNRNPTHLKDIAKLQVIVFVEQWLLYKIKKANYQIVSLEKRFSLYL